MLEPTRLLTRPLLLGGFMAMVAACGGSGGGGDAPGNPVDTGATSSQPTPVVSKGVITGFGSVYVNDIRYEVDDDTAVNVDDEDERVGDDGALQLGMKVKVEASEQDGRYVARSIEHRRDLKGPVTEIVLDTDDPALGSFRVARTPVVVDANTVFDDNVGDNDGNRAVDIRDLAAERGRLVVAVSGFATDDGYLATRISRLSDDDDDVEIRGFVDAVDPTGGTLTVSGTVFAVTAATVFEDDATFDDDLIGAFVEVEARRIDDGYEALEVDREDDEDDDRRGRFEIEGILISVDTTVTPNLVQIGERTLEVRDASALAALVGVKVSIKGTFDEDGVLIIDRSRVEDDNVGTEDRVVSVDAAAGTFTTRLGLVIRPEGISRLEDDADDDDDDRLTPEQFLERLRANDWIEAHGFQSEDGAVTWTRIEREDEDDDEQQCELRGPVAAIADDLESFDVLGITVDIAAARSVEFEDEDDDWSGRQAFLDRLEIAAVVEAESDDADGCQTGLLLADEVEIEDGEPPRFSPPGGEPAPGDPDTGEGDVVFLIIDEDSIDNGNPPNDFSETDVNDDLAEVGQRQPLRWFRDNVDSTIDLFTGQVGDEGWFALKTVPGSWRETGPTGNGTRNYLLAGPGLGGPPGGDDREVLLDGIPDVTPLRATGLAMLTGRVVCALVYDGDVGINYSPLTGNLQGANLGLIGLEVESVTERTDGSTSALPRVGVRVRDAGVCERSLSLFANAPAPASSSEPFDVAPPVSPPALQLAPAS